MASKKATKKLQKGKKLQAKKPLEVSFKYGGPGVTYTPQ